MLFFLNAISLMCSTLRTGSYLLWRTISPSRSSPKKARRKTHLNSFTLFGEEHTCGNASINLVNNAGVIGNLVSGVSASLPAPLRAVLTINEAQGSDLCFMPVAYCTDI